MYPHQQAIQDNNLDIKALPANIRQQIGGFNMQFAKYQKSPSDKQGETLTAISVRIADMIQNHVESALDTPPAPPAPKKEEPLTPPAPPTNGMKNAASASDLKAELQKHLDREGRIYHVDLKRLLNKRELDDKETVEGVTLERSWAFYYPV